MADLGNLWFSLGLDDSKFEKQWNTAFAKYKKQANIDVRLTIDKTGLKDLKSAEGTLNQFKKNFKGNIKGKIDLDISQRTLDSLRALQAMGGSVEQWKAIQQAAKAAGQLAMDHAKVTNTLLKGQKDTTKEYKVQSLWLQNLKNIAQEYFSLYAIRDFITNVATVTGEFEKQRVTLQAMIGEMEGLDIYGKMKSLSIESPFQFKELASYTKQLASFSVPYEEIYDTTKRLADISAGVGVDMSRIILAFGQIKSAGVLKGTELRQLTEAGIPVLDKLAEKFSQIEGRAVSVGDVFGKISQKLVPFEMINDIFKDLTSEGGKFYNMQAIQADTLSGKISNLKDAYDIMLTKVGESNEGALKMGVGVLYDLINNWETLGRVVVTAVTAFSGYQLGQMVYWITSQETGLAKLIKRYRDLRTEMGKMAAFSKAGWWSVIAAAVTGITMALIQASLSATKFNREMDKLISTKYSEMDGEIDSLNRLKSAIDSANKGSQERRDLIKDMNSRYGSYLGYLLEEEAAASEVANAHGRIADEIERKRKAEALQMASQKVEDDYGSKVATEISKFEERLKKRGVDIRSRAYISKFVQDYIKNNLDATSMDIEKAMKDSGRFTEKQIKDTSIALLKNLSVFGDSLSSLKEAIKEYRTKIQEAIDKVDAVNEAGSYDSVEQAAQHRQIEAAYESVIAYINKKTGTTLEQVEEERTQATIRKLTALRDLYGEATVKGREYQAQIEALNKDTGDWRDTILQLASKKGISSIFAPQTTEDWFEYYDRMDKEYKSLKEKLSNIGTDPTGMRSTIEAQIAFLDSIANKYNVQFDQKGSNKAEQERLKKQREEVDKLRNSYNNLFNLFTNFNKLSKSSGLGASSVLEALKKYAGEDYYKALSKVITDGGDIDKWFEDNFSQIAKDAIEKGGEAGKAFADSISRTLQNSNIKEDIDIFKIAKDIEKELRQWGLEDFTLTGKGAALDISKAIREQEIADNKAKDRALQIAEQVKKAKEGDEAAVALLREKYGEQWLDNAIKRANELRDKEIENNATVAQEKINDLAKRAAKEDLGKAVSEGFMQSLGDKSISQLSGAQKKLQKLLVSEPDFMFDAEFLDKLAAAEVDLDTFLQTYKEYILLQAQDVSAEIWGKKRDNIIQTGQALSSTLASLAEFADRNNNKGITNFVRGLKESLDIAIKIGEALDFDTETGKIKADAKDIVALIAQIVTGVFNYFTNAKELADKAEISFRAFADAVDLARIKAIALEDDLDTIFGKNSIRSLDAWSKQITEAWENINEAIEGAGKINLSGGRYKQESWQYLYDIRAQLEETEALGSKLQKMTYSLGDKRFLFWNTTRYSMLGAEFPELFKEDGGLNFDYLPEFLENAENLDKAQREFFQNLLNNYEVYKEAIENINNYLTDIFSDTASTIADRMLEAFAVTGNAATELGDLVNNVAKGMVKDLIQSLLIEQYLTPAMDRIKALYNPESAEYEEDPTVRIQKSILAMQDGLQAAQGGAEHLSKLLQGFADLGIDFSEGAGNGSDVLSGLTEQQQNLLMGYINGIRADVSINKGLLTNIVNSVGTISNNIATAIVVWKQIEANTHRSADGVDRIIGYFDNLMGPYDGGGGQALRVNIA